MLGFTFGFISASGSRFETYLISAHRAFNAEHCLFTHVCGYTLDISELSKVHSRDYLESVFRVAGRIKKLELTVEEQCVLRGIVILSRGKNYCSDAVCVRVLP